MKPHDLSKKQALTVFAAADYYWKKKKKTKTKEQQKLSCSIERLAVMQLTAVR